MTHFYFQEIGLGEVFCDRELQNNPFSVPLRAALASVMFLVLLTWQKLCRGDVQRRRAWPQSAEPSAGNANPIGKKLFISERKKKKPPRVILPAKLCLGAKLVHTPPVWRC